MFKNSLFYATTSLSRRLEAVWSEAYAPLGLTAAQAFVLRVILDKPNVQTKELVDTLYLSKHEIANVLSDLKKMGMIERVFLKVDSDDGHIRPTQLGYEIQAELLEKSNAVIELINKNIGRELYLDIISKIYKSKEISF